MMVSVLIVVEMRVTAAEDGSGDSADPVPQDPVPQELGTTKGWRLQFSAEYTRLDGSYNFESDFLPYSVTGERDSDIYGGTVSLGLPRWKETSWMTLSYRMGEATGHNDYEGGGFPTVRTPFDADLTEFEIGYRSALKTFVGGVSFVYQNWESRENIPWFGPVKYDDKFYLGTFDVGPGKLWTFKSGLALGLKGSIGGGLGYADIGRPDAEGDGFLMNGFGSGSALFQYALKGRGIRGRLYLEGGYKGMVYYALNAGEYADESHFWWYHGPFAKAGIMFLF